MRLLRTLLGRASAGNGHDNGGVSGDLRLLDRTAFQREMRRWRALVDRAGGQFVLAVFEIPANSRTKNGRSAISQTLVEVIRDRARLSDVVGMFDESRSRIGVILPETTSTGAAIFVQSVEELLRSQLNGHLPGELSLSCEISYYPDTGTRVDDKGDVTAGADKPMAATRTGEYAFKGLRS